MKHLQDIIQEGLLDIEDNEKSMDSVVAKELLVDWLTYRPEYRGFIEKEVSVEGDRLNYQGSVNIGEETKPLPKIVQLGKVVTLNINANQKVFDKCKKQLPYKANQMYVGGIDVKNFEIETFNATFYRDVKSIKNVILNIPATRPGLTLNKFFIRFHVKKRDIVGLKINGVNNIVVECDDCEIGEFIVNQVRYEVSTYKRKNGMFETREELNAFIMDILYKHLPMDHIDKHWNGVKRIVFKDRDGRFSNGVGLGYVVDDVLKSGDFMIEKNNKGEWVPYQKMFKVIS
jgi:hypothetical protein